MCGLPQRIIVMLSAISRQQYLSVTTQTTKTWSTSGEVWERKLSFHLGVLGWAEAGPVRSCCIYLRNTL